MTTLDLIGSSPKFRAVLMDVDRIAPADSAVLIQGETGTGKEVIARAIHEASPRRNHRFVALNCAAIPSALLESELFGHEKGAFTGAWAQTKGRFQMADGGTLFLDEIGDMPLELQPKLLRALQEREFERLGGAQSVRVNVRVVAATNQDLGQLVSKKQFRADLFYRLNVIPICLPPLRERVHDILPLTEFFVAKFAASLNRPIDSIPDEVVEVLKAYDWPADPADGGEARHRRTVSPPGRARRRGPDAAGQRGRRRCRGGALVDEGIGRPCTPPGPGGATFNGNGKSSANGHGAPGAQRRAGQPAPIGTSDSARTPVGGAPIAAWPAGTPGPRPGRARATGRRAAMAAAAPQRRLGVPACRSPGRGPARALPPGSTRRGPVPAGPVPPPGQSRPTPAYPQWPQPPAAAAGGAPTAAPAARARRRGADPTAVPEAPRPARPGTPLRPLPSRSTRWARPPWARFRRGSRCPSRLSEPLATPRLRGRCRMPRSAAPGRSRQPVEPCAVWTARVWFPSTCPGNR